MLTESERRNLVIVETAFEAFARRDMATVAAIFHADAHWRVPPMGVLKGNYRGRDQILGFFAHLAHETGGTYSTVPVAVAAAGNRVFAQNRASATRKGTLWTWDVVYVFQFEPADGVATSVHQYMLDYPAAQRFWA